MQPCFKHSMYVTCFAWEAAIADTVKRFGGLDVLVNNAGGGSGGRIDLETLEQHRRIVDLNLTGVWSGMRSVIPAMTARGGGSIVNISSIDGLVGSDRAVTHLSTSAPMNSALHYLIAGGLSNAY